MNTILHTQPVANQPGGGGIWYQLRAEREQICESLLGAAHSSYKLGDALETTRTDDAILLEARLRLIDDALDRLMSGAYGDCVTCGRWIEDTKLHTDPAQPFCCACQHRSSIAASIMSHVPHQLGGSSPANRGVLRG